MATTESMTCLSLNASADLSTHQFKFVKVSGSNAVTIVAASTDVALGVLQNKAASGQPAQVAIAGRTKVIAGAAVAAGAHVMPNASGLAVTATATNRARGIALTAAANANELIDVALLIVPVTA